MTSPKNEITKAEFRDDDAPLLPVANPGALSHSELMGVLKSSLYPGAADASVALVISYCAAANLDVMQKPVHIVPMWNSAAGRMVDTIMPGIALYRITAARSGLLAGISEPEYGPTIRATIGGADVEYPEWCRVTVRRRLVTGELAEFTAREFWTENYAVRGGKEKSIAPNTMWAKRPHGQLAKCTESQALRRAFPEMCSAPTAEEMEGKVLQERDVTPRKQSEFPKLITESTAPEPWQNFYPSAWYHTQCAVGDPPFRAFGEIYDAEGGEKAMLDLWRDDKTSGPLCAWAADWMKATLIPSISEMTWDEVQREYDGLPPLDECMPKHLRLAAGWLLQCRDRQDAKEAQTEGGAA